MRSNWTTCSRRWGAPGLTLIEVVAAIAIVGTVLVGIVMARTRHTRQSITAEHKLAAVNAADELLAEWWLDGRRVPLDGEGELDTKPEMTWQTFEVSNAPINDLNARVVRLEVWPVTAPDAFDKPDKPLVMVDLVLSKEDQIGEDGERYATPRVTPPTLMIELKPADGDEELPIGTDTSGGGSGGSGSNTTGGATAQPGGGR